MRIAGDPDAHRFRDGGARGRGGRAIRRLISSTAAAQTYTAGGQASQMSGGGAGGAGSGGSRFVTTPPVEGVPTGGIPTTGHRYAIWGIFSWNSALDHWGA